MFSSDPRQSVQFNKNRDNGRKPTSGNQVTDKRKLQASNETTLAGNDNKSQQMKKNEAAVRLYKPVAADSGLRRPPSSNDQRKTNMELKMQQKVENGTLTKRPLVTHQEVRKIKNSYMRQICTFVIISDLNFMFLRNPSVRMTPLSSKPLSGNFKSAINKLKMVSHSFFKSLSIRHSLYDIKLNHYT